MDSYAIISDFYETREGYKDFQILMENLTKEQVIALRDTIPLFMEKLKTMHYLNINLKIEGFEYEINGEMLSEMKFYGRVIPMCTLENFK